MSKPNTYVSLTEFQEQVCIGSLLGDMSASCGKEAINYNLACYHAEKQIEWLKVKWEWLQPYSRPIQYCSYLDKRDGKTRNGARFHTVSAPCFTTIANYFYSTPPKIVPLDIVNLMTHPVALACLICDDGSWDRAGIQIASKNFTVIENERLAECLNANYDVPAYASKNGKYPMVRIPAQGVERTFELCQPFVPEFLYYKFGGPDYKTTRVGFIDKQCRACGKTFSTYESSNQKFCSFSCAASGKQSGYATRTKTAICPVCQQEYVVYMSSQRTCRKCVDVPLPHEVCEICGKPVKKHGNNFCSIRCSSLNANLAKMLTD